MQKSSVEKGYLPHMVFNQKPWKNHKNTIKNTRMESWQFFQYIYIYIYIYIFFFFFLEGTVTNFAI